MPCSPADTHYDSGAGGQRSAQFVALSWIPPLRLKRFAPPRHQVGTEEADREMLIADDKESDDLALLAALFKKNADGGKEDARNRANEPATFAMVGLAPPSSRIGE